MSKKVKAPKSPKLSAADVLAAVDAMVTPAPQAAMVTIPAPQAIVVAKLTRRNSTPVTAVLALTDKAPRNRADHIKNAWDAVVQALPATAVELGEVLDALGQNPNGTNLSYISYWIQRGFLRVQD